MINSNNNNNYKKKKKKKELVRMINNKFKINCNNLEIMKKYLQTIMRVI